MNGIWVPLVTLLIAVAALFPLVKASAAPESPKLGHSAHASGGICLLIAALILAISRVLEDKTGFYSGFGAGFPVGALVAVALGFIGSRFDSGHKNFITPVGIGLALAGFALQIPEAPRIAALFGAVAGLGISSWVLGIAPTNWPSLAAVSSFSAVPFLMYGFKDKASLPANMGLIVGLAALVVALIVRWAISSEKSNGSWIRTLVLGVISGLVAWSGGLALGWEEQMATICGFGIAIGLGATLASDFLEESPTAAILNALIQLGGGTVAFLWFKTPGLVAYFATAGLIPLLSGNRLAISGLSALAGLVVMRTIQVVNSQLPAEYDVAQHYGLMGLALGVYVVILAVTWQSRSRLNPSTKVVLAAGLGVVAMLVLLNGVSMTLNERGQFAVVVGFLFAAPLVAMMKEDGLRAFGVASGGSCLYLALIRHQSSIEALTRDERVKMLGFHAGGLLILIALIVFLSQHTQTSSASPSEVQKT